MLFSNHTKNIAPLLAKLVIFNLLITNIVYAYNNKDNDEYQIELILFKYNDHSSIYNEHWPLVEINHSPSNITIYNNSEVLYDNDYYMNLPEELLKYKFVSKNISNNSRYTVINHLGWRLPRKDIAQSKTIYFETGEKFPTYNSNEISGTIKFSFKKYIHANFDIILNQPAIKEEQYNTNSVFKIIDENKINDFAELAYMQPFEINESKRLKESELVYLDNPAFGIVAVITKITA